MSLPFLDQFEIVNFTLVQDLNLWQLLAMLLYFGLGHIYCQKLLKICFFFIYRYVARLGEKQNVL